MKKSLILFSIIVMILLVLGVDASFATNPPPPPAPPSQTPLAIPALLAITAAFGGWFALRKRS